MLTAADRQAWLKEYQEGQWDQMWICETNSDGRIGMRNRDTKKFLGLREDNRIICAATYFEIGEWLTFTRLSLGGYSLKVYPEGKDKLELIEHAFNS